MNNGPIAVKLHIRAVSIEVYICNGYGGGIISTRQEQLISFIQYESWGASPESGT